MQINPLFKPFIIFFILCFAGCSGSSNTNNDLGGTNTLQTGNLKLSDIEKFDSQQIEEDFDAFVQDNNEFCFEFYQGVKAVSEDNNFFLSPYSFSSALAMTWAGARGETESQMANVLRFRFSQIETHALFNKLNTTLNEKGMNNPEEFSLYVSNAIWGQNDFHFEQDFLDIISDNYGAGLTRLDFISDPDNSRIIINDWVEEQTEQRIKDLIPKSIITDETRLVLTNTIYFKADWLAQFDKDITEAKEFRLFNGAITTVDMMHHWNNEFSYSEGADYQAVELPYKDEKTAMVIVLPKENKFTEFETNLNTTKMNEILTSMSKHLIDLWVPKFSFEYTAKELIAMLTEMGMIDAFCGNADFAGMTGDRSLHISFVLQKTFVQVDEFGTEAAAATAVGMGSISVLNYYAIMNINHPFIFFILDKETNSILFIGRVMNPTES